MALLEGTTGLVRIAEGNGHAAAAGSQSEVVRLTDELRRTGEIRWSPGTEADLEQFLVSSLKEAYGMLTEPYVDDLAAQGFMDILSASTTEVQQGLDFYGTIRLNIIWRARWLARVAPMAKQALRIYTGFVLNGGIAKPITKTHSQLTRAQSSQAEADADAHGTQSPGSAPQPGPPSPATTDARGAPGAQRGATGSQRAPLSLVRAKEGALLQEARPTVPGAPAGDDAPDGAQADTDADPDAAPPPSGRSRDKPDPDPIQQVIDEHWDDPDNAQITTLAGLEETIHHRQIDGELFWALFVEEGTGHVKIRRLDPTRVVDIVTHPDDSARTLYYRVRRVAAGSGGPQEAPGASGAYKRSEAPPTSADATRVPPDEPGPGGTSDLIYRDWMNTDDDPARDPFRAVYGTDVQPGVVLAHFATNRLGKFGLSELFAGGDWLRAHKRFNENRASLTEALRRIALLLTIKGGQQQVSAAQQMLQSSLTAWGGGGGGGWESNPAPTTASMMALNPGVQLDQFKVDTGAGDATQDGEMLLQMYAASVGFATHYFGSGQMHVLATATAMELPILRYLQKEQKWWLDMIRRLVDFILREAVRARTIPGARLKERFGYDWVDWQDLDPSYDIEAAPIVNVDPQQTVTAITSAHQDALITDEDAAHKAYVALGTDNVDEHMGRWAAWHLQKQAQEAAQQPPQMGGAPPGAKPPFGGPGGPQGGGQDNDGSGGMGNDNRPMGASPSGPSTAETQRRRGQEADADADALAADVQAREAAGHKFTYASTQLDIPPEHAAWIQRAANVDPDDLAGDGRETAPHITVLYGLHDTSPATLAKIQEVCRQLPPVRLRLGATATFPPSAASDGAAPVYISVTSDEVRDLNYRIADAVPHTTTHAHYTPHVTLAYVKPERATRYSGQTPLDGVEITVPALTVSDRDGNVVRIPLTGRREDIAPIIDPPFRLIEAGGGHWVTIEQDGEYTHIFIGAGGTVTKGPQHLIGAQAGHLPPIPGRRAVTHHPEGHEPAGAREHPTFVEHQPPEKKAGQPYAREHGAPQTRQEQGPTPLTREQAEAGLQRATQDQKTARAQAEVDGQEQEKRTAQAEEERAKLAAEEEKRTAQKAEEDRHAEEQARIERDAREKEITRQTGVEPTAGGAASGPEERAATGPAEQFAQQAQTPEGLRQIARMAQSARFTSALAEEGPARTALDALGELHGKAPATAGATAEQLAQVRAAAPLLARHQEFEATPRGQEFKARNLSYDYRDMSRAELGKLWKQTFPDKPVPGAHVGTEEIAARLAVGQSGPGARGLSAAGRAEMAHEELRKAHDAHQPLQAEIAPEHISRASYGRTRMERFRQKHQDYVDALPAEHQALFRASGGSVRVIPPSALADRKESSTGIDIQSRASGLYDPANKTANVVYRPGNRIDTDVALHEMGHHQDWAAHRLLTGNEGTPSFGDVATGAHGKNTLSSQPDFRALYARHKDNDAWAPYYRLLPSELFAQGYAYYHGGKAKNRALKEAAPDVHAYMEKLHHRITRAAQTGEYVDEPPTTPGPTTPAPRSGRARMIEAGDDAPAEDDPRRLEEAGGGHWITIEQDGEYTHIFIGSGGVVTKGPAHLIGARAGHLPPIEGRRTVTHHPEGHEPAGAREHPSFTEHQAPQKKAGRPYAREQGAAQTRQEQGPRALSAEESAAGLQTAIAEKKAAAEKNASAEKRKAAAEKRKAILRSYPVWAVPPKVTAAAVRHAPGSFASEDEARTWLASQGVYEIKGSPKKLSLSDMNAVAQHVAKLPQEVVASLQKRGGMTRLVKDTGITADPLWSHAAGLRPRGWTHGTWDNVPGSGGTEKNPYTVIVANSLDRGHGSADLILHETAHTFDNAGGMGTFSQSAAWQDIWKSVDWQTDYEAYYAEEGFAESFARYFGGQRDQLPQRVQDYWATLPATIAARTGD